jgi:hypothetical protein
MERVMATRPKWGVLYFAYDWFSAVRTEVVRDIRYDTFITVYTSDCDFYPRVRQRWRTIEHTSVCPDCAVRVVDMRRPLKLPLHDYERSLHMLEGAARPLWGHDDPSWCALPCVRCDFRV